MSSANLGARRCRPRTPTSMATPSKFQPAYSALAPRCTPPSASETRGSRPDCQKRPKPPCSGSSSRPPKLSAPSATSNERAPRQLSCAVRAPGGASAERQPSRLALLTVMRPTSHHRPPRHFPQERAAAHRGRTVSIRTRDDHRLRERRVAASSSLSLAVAIVLPAPLLRLIRRLRLLRRHRITGGAASASASATAPAPCPRPACPLQQHHAAHHLPRLQPAGGVA